MWGERGKTYNKRSITEKPLKPVFINFILLVIMNCDLVLSIEFVFFAGEGGCFKAALSKKRGVKCPAMIEARGV